MSKIAIVGDTHFGVRGGDENFLDFQIKWFSCILMPYLKANGIKNVIQTGDLFDTRQHIKFNVMGRFREEIIPLFIENGISLFVLAGNHDCFYRDNNKYTAIDWVEAEWYKQSMDYYSRNDVSVFGLVKEDVSMIEIDGLKIDLVPWINKNNHEKILLDMADKTGADIAIGHFEIVGMPMYTGVVAQHGLSPDVFATYKKVISGHYHTISEHKQIQYVGTPYHLTWADYVDGDNRGFWILDTETLDLELVKNPEYATLFSVLEYDKDENYAKFDFSPYEGTILKVIVDGVEDERHKKKFMEALAKVTLIDYKVIDNTVFKTVVVEEDGEDGELFTSKPMVDQFDSYVDSQDVDRPEKVKDLLQQIYLEALNVVK